MLRSSPIQSIMNENSTSQKFQQLLTDAKDAIDYGEENGFEDEEFEKEG